MSALDDFSDEDQQKFLRVIHESLSIDRHFQLFLWLQGDLQYFLPHDILIALVGNFATGDLKFDMVSALPGVRTENCCNCDLKPISQELFERWQRNGQQMLTFTGGVETVLTAACHCPIRGAFRKMQSVIVQGLRDMRSGEDALYVVMFSRPEIDERVRKVFSILLPQIDSACRRVTSYSRRPPPLPPAEAKPADTIEDAGLSPREMEILEWVRNGKTNHEIGVILNISAFTVKNHLQRIFRKIDVINRTQAVAKLDQLSRRP